MCIREINEQKEAYFRFHYIAAYLSAMLYLCQ